jgi:chromosome segregation ATPase
VNNPRRKELERIANAITELKEQLEILQEEEDEYRDNMPENLQGSERYEKAEATCENLYSAVSSLEEAIDFINESME